MKLVDVSHSNTYHIIYRRGGRGEQDFKIIGLSLRVLGFMGILEKIARGFCVHPELNSTNYKLRNSVY